MMVTESFRVPFRHLDLNQQLQWLVRLRWVAVCGLTAAIILAWVGGAVTQVVPALWSVTAWLAVLNVVYYRQVHRFSQDEQAAARFGHLQIVMDLLLLAVLVHLTGGIENPLLFYFGFHIAIAAILFGLRRAVLFACLATALGVVIGAGELFGLLPHHHLGLGPCGHAFYQGHIVGFVLFALASVSFGTAYLVSNVERRAAELKRRAVHQEQLVSLGMLAAGIAHEIGNPLAVISSVAQMLRRKADDEKTHQRADLVLDHVNRIRKIVEDMVHFARPPERHERLVEVNAVVRQSLDLIQYDPRAKRVELETHLAEDLPPVCLSPEQLLQVCMNLLINAMDAVDPKGGRLSVETAMRDGQVAITIEDNGTGIPKEIQDRIFEPFFTTKPVGKGTGLGLSVSFGIVHSFGGSITFECGPNQGTWFCVQLPRSEFQEGHDDADTAG